MRRIETEAGTLTGKVDRVARKVVWSLQCPACTQEVRLSERQFTGHAPVKCRCGWAAPVEDPLAADDAPRYFDYSYVFETVPPKEAAA